ncbi:MAG: hypothetical protein RIC19_01110 [Phaeodactylibacter sp.]|uniref:hypothetical protein n=1 Tax=Phaeodactylibacter sp. TaxID=1940289 RepID=UPI0032EC1158
MKNFALTLLLTVLTLHLSAAAIHWSADTLKCDTLLLKNGIELYARVLDISGDAFTVQYCNDDRKTSIAGSKLNTIRFGDGRVMDKAEIRRKMRQQRRIANVSNPDRTTLKGALQLLGVLPTGLATAYFVFAIAFSGAGSILYIIPIALAILMIYLLVKGVSNLVLAARLRKEARLREPRKGRKH